MQTEEAAVEGDGWEEGERWWPGAGFEGDGGGGGRCKETEAGAHVGREYVQRILYV